MHVMVIGIAPNQLNVSFAQYGLTISIDIDDIGSDTRRCPLVNYYVRL